MFFAKFDFKLLTRQHFLYYNYIFRNIYYTFLLIWKILFFAGGGMMVTQNILEAFYYWTGFYEC